MAKLLTTPMNKTLGVNTWNIPSKITCPNKTPFCSKYCYAGKGNFLYDNVKKSHAKNLIETKDNNFVDNMVHTITKRNLKVFRIHSSGDFYNAKYFFKWIRIIKQCPDCMFYAYTKNWLSPNWVDLINYANSLHNFHLWSSADPSTQDPTELGLVKCAYVSLTETTCDKQIDHETNCLNCKKCYSGEHNKVVFKKH